MRFSKMVLIFGLLAVTEVVLPIVYSDEMKKEKPLRFLELKGHTDRVSSVTFSPDWKRVATGSEDHTAKIWDAETGKELRTLAGHKYTVCSVEYSPDGKMILTKSIDNQFIIWDVATYKELFKVSDDNRNPTPLIMAISRDWKRIVTRSWSNDVIIWDVATGKELFKLLNSWNFVTSVRFSPDEKRILTESLGNCVEVWDAATGKRLFVDYLGHGVAVSFSPDGKRVVTGSKDNIVRIWDAATGKELFNFSGNTDLILSVWFSRDGKRILTRSNRTVIVWDAATGKELFNFSGNTDLISLAWFSRDGERVLVTRSQDRTARICEAETGKELCTLAGDTDGVFSVEFSPDGERIVTNSEDHTVRIWDTATGKELFSILRNTNALYSVWFCPDRKRIVTTSVDHTVRIWDAATGKELWNLAGNKNTISSLWFSPDGERILTGSEDKTAIIWFLRPKHDFSYEGLSEELGVLAHSAYRSEGRKKFLVEIQRIFVEIKKQESSEPQLHPAEVGQYAITLLTLHSYLSNKNIGTKQFSDEVVIPSLEEEIKDLEVKYGKGELANIGLSVPVVTVVIGLLRASAIAMSETSGLSEADHAQLKNLLVVLANHQATLRTLDPKRLGALYRETQSLLQDLAAARNLISTWSTGETPRASYAKVFELLAKHLEAGVR